MNNVVAMSNDKVITIITLDDANLITHFVVEKETTIQDGDEQKTVAVRTEFHPHQQEISSHQIKPDLMTV